MEEAEIEFRAAALVTWYSLSCSAVVASSIAWSNSVWVLSRMYMGRSYLSESIKLSTVDLPRRGHCLRMSDAKLWTIMSGSTRRTQVLDIHKVTTDPVKHFLIASVRGSKSTRVASKDAVMRR